jgi:hypothetical protein
MSGHALSDGGLTVHGHALATPVAIAVAELTTVAVLIAECRAATVLIAVLRTVDGPTHRLPEVREPILLGRLSACVCTNAEVRRPWNRGRAWRGEAQPGGVASLVAPRVLDTLG